MLVRPATASLLGPASLVLWLILTAGNTYGWHSSDSFEGGYLLLVGLAAVAPLTGLVAAYTYRDTSSRERRVCLAVAAAQYLTLTVGIVWLLSNIPYD